MSRSSLALPPLTLGSREGGTLNPLRTGTILGAAAAAPKITTTTTQRTYTRTVTPPPEEEEEDYVTETTEEEEEITPMAEVRPVSNRTYGRGITFQQLGIPSPFSRSSTVTTTVTTPVTTPRRVRTSRKKTVTVNTLQNISKILDLPSSGTKDVLISNIIEALREEA